LFYNYESDYQHFYILRYADEAEVQITKSEGNPYN